MRDPPPRSRQALVPQVKPKADNSCQVSWYLFLPCPKALPMATLVLDFLTVSSGDLGCGADLSCCRSPEGREAKAPAGRRGKMRPGQDSGGMQVSNLGTARAGVFARKEGLWV